LLPPPTPEALAEASLFKILTCTMCCSSNCKNKS
jgi:hypothetical protein